MSTRQLKVAPQDSALNLYRAPGDDARLNELIAAEYPRIVRLARRFGLAEHDAEDAAQEVLAKAWAKQSTFGNRATVSTWITRIALNHFASLLKRERRRAAILSGLRVVGVQPHPRNLAQNGEAFELAARCLQSLTRKQREAFVLHYLEGLSYRDLAGVLKISEGAARIRAYEARRRLRDMLGEFEL